MTIKFPTLEQFKAQCAVAIENREEQTYFRITDNDAVAVKIEFVDGIKRFKSSLIIFWYSCDWKQFTIYEKDFNGSLDLWYDRWIRQLESALNSFAKLFA